MILEKQHANKLINIQSSPEVEIASGEFTAGDVLILFNNSEFTLKIKSHIKNTYRSGTHSIVKEMHFLPRCLINAAFIDSETVVFSGGS